MSEKSNSFDSFDILLSIDLRYMNTLRKSIADVWTLNVPFHDLHSTLCKISHCLYNRFLIDVISIS